jgi:hypothetical protein
MRAHEDDAVRRARQLARNRWQLARLLLANPSLRAHRAHALLAPRLATPVSAVDLVAKARKEAKEAAAKEAAAKEFITEHAEA